MQNSRTTDKIFFLKDLVLPKKTSINWNNAHFLYSAGVESDLRPLELPEIALVGRSNVGKSSLINHLLNQKDLARVSKTPGKTKLINFFNIDDQFLLVDLPGYGYAKVGHSEKERWAEAIESYLAKRKSLILICQLIDSRHPPTEEDISFAQWVHTPLLYVYTKCDHGNSYNPGILPQKSVAQVHYSIRVGTARQVLRAHLLRAIDETTSN